MSRPSRRSLLPSFALLSTLPLLAALLSAMPGCSDGGDVPLTGVYDLALSGGTDDPFPPDVVPATVELVITEDEDDFLEVLFGGESPSSVGTVTIGGQTDMTLEATLPVVLEDPADCPVEFVPPTGTVELHIEDGQVDGTAEADAFCDSASAHYRFDLTGERR